MSWLSRLLKGADSVVTSLDLWKLVYGSRESSSGKPVTLDTAFQTAVVYAICRCIAEGVAQIPFRLMQEVNGKRTNLSNTQLGQLVSKSPNPIQTSFEWRETTMLHLLMTNNAYMFVGRVGLDREPRYIRPILPNSVRVKLEPDNETVRYFVRGLNGSEVEFPAENIWHIRGPSWAPHIGLDVLKVIANALGLAAKIEDNQAAMNKNGLQAAGVLSFDNKLSSAQYDFLAAWLDKHQPGGDRFNKPMILDQGGEWTTTQMTGVDAQLLETRRYQVEELCRPFRIMPLMIGYSDKTATYASAEQMFIAHVVHCLAPWYQRLEESANKHLLSDTQRKQGLYFKFFPDGLLRGDIASRYSSYSKALGSGGGRAWLTVNEVRAFQDLDAIEGGDVLPEPIQSLNPGLPPPNQE
jgi:HK97 family phage portal protein